jgi:uncharacterized membrane protein
VTETLTLLGTALGLGASAGVNAYAPMLVFGLMARFNPSFFPADLAGFFGQTWVLVVIGILYAVEFVADKIPAIDHVWDVIHTFIRPVAGAVVALAAAAPGTPRGIVILAGAIAGGAALTGHFTKASVRAVSTATTGGTANPLLSIVEDIYAVIQTSLAVVLPYVCIAFAIVFLTIAIFVVSRLRPRKQAR